jgi:hypothetical protein
MEIRKEAGHVYGPTKRSWFSQGSCVSKRWVREGSSISRTPSPPNLITSLLLEIPQEPPLARETCIHKFHFFISGEYSKQ